MMAPEYNSPKYYQDYQVNPRNFPLLYITYDGCLATPPGSKYSPAMTHADDWGENVASPSRRGFESLVVEDI